MSDQLFDTHDQPTFDLAHGLYRPTDEPTAQGAAIIAIGNRTVNKQRVLNALYTAGEYGATDFELAAATGLIATSAGKRRKDLQDEEPSLVRRAADEDGNALSRPSTTGTPARVWCLTAAGYMAAESRPVDNQRTNT